MLKVDQSGKNSICQKRRPYRTQTLAIAILGIPVTYSRHNGKCNICAFHDLKTGFLLDYQVLFLLLNGPQMEKSAA